ncbi:MAG: hypothetical protein QME51_03090 [Planctomycetota bacterium]|nr:hypothetical protein [Planctomycetota bacterium]
MLINTTVPTIILTTFIKNPLTRCYGDIGASYSELDPDDPAHKLCAGGHRGIQCFIVTCPTLSFRRAGSYPASAEKSILI